MVDNESSITVARAIPASSKSLFQVLTLPRNHVALDGSGFVRSDEHGDRITATGQTFRMNMSGPHMGGDYQTDNVVTGYVPDKLVAWQTAPADTDPPGWEWVWEMDATGPDSTDVRLTYDWSKVTDKQVLEQVSFPLVTQSQLEDSLEKLAAAVD